jgi:MFS family permease
LSPIHALVISHTFNQSVFAGNRFLVAVFAVKQGASPFVVGLLMALFAIAPMLFTVPAGKLIDRIGTRRPLQLCLALLAAATLAPFFWTEISLMYVTAALVGGAFFPIYLAVTAMVNKHSAPGERAGNFSKVSVGISVAQGLGALVAGVSADHLGYGAAFAVITLFPLAGYLLLLRAGVTHVGPGKPASITPGSKARTFDLLRSRDMRSVFVFGTLFILAWDIFIVMLPIYGSQLGLSASQMGLVMSAYAVASIAVRMAGPWLARHWTPWQLMLLALALAAVSTMAFGFITAMPLLMACAFSMGLGQGLGSPMASTALYEVAPRERAAEAMGLRVTFGMAAQSALPLAVGSVGALLAAAPIFWISGLVLMTGVVTERRQWRRPAAKTHAA